ncbi:MAG: hypothetical protein DRP58_11535, partial [Spirochaetes bacterium]
KSRKIVIFNKSDTADRISKAKEIAENISKSLNIERVLITSMTGNDPVMAVIEPGANKWNFFRQQQN